MSVIDYYPDKFMKILLALLCTVAQLIVLQSITSNPIQTLYLYYPHICKITLLARHSHDEAI